MPFTRWLFHADQRHLCLVPGSPRTPAPASSQHQRLGGGRGTSGPDGTLVFSTQPMKRTHWQLLSCGIRHVMGGHTDVRAISKMTPAAPPRRTEVSAATFAAAISTPAFSTRQSSSLFTCFYLFEITTTHFYNYILLRFIK